MQSSPQLPGAEWQHDAQRQPSDWEEDAQWQQQLPRPSIDLIDFYYFPRPRPSVASVDDLDGNRHQERAYITAKKTSKTRAVEAQEDIARRYGPPPVSPLAFAMNHPFGFLLFLIW
jgi:hypothetical protein